MRSERLLFLTNSLKMNQLCNEFESTTYDYATGQMLIYSKFLLQVFKLIFLPRIRLFQIFHNIVSRLYSLLYVFFVSN